MGDAIAAWVLRYVAAWASNDPEAIAGLFSHDARYYRAPHLEPIVGRGGIVDWWLDARDEPGTWSFRFEILGVDGSVGFVRGWTEYRDEDDYLNLWVIRLNQAGECTEFTEWVEADPSNPG